MIVSPKEIARLASLAQLPLSGGEAAALRADLDAILAHVSTLDALAHRSVPPFAGTGPACAPLRDDDGLPDPMLLSPDALAPDWEDGFFVVPRLASHAASRPSTRPPASLVGAAIGWSAVGDHPSDDPPDDVSADPATPSDAGHEADGRAASVDPGSEHDVDPTHGGPSGSQG
jgi:aspartyl-tRNA(Asn)/glutamyl-tRNA(Gln) amidotransferase subunit C